jgi:hypothetical protein
MQTRVNMGGHFDNGHADRVMTGVMTGKMVGTVSVVMSAFAKGEVVDAKLP